MKSHAYPKWQIRALLFNSDNAPSENFRAKSVPSSPGYSHSDLMGLNVSILSPLDYQRGISAEKVKYGEFPTLSFSIQHFFVYFLTQFSKKVSLSVFCYVGMTAGQ